MAARSWVMLAYRMPREPSSPRIVVWRRLRRLGVAQPVDGLVLLPAEPRTREGMEWVAEQVVAAGGQATLWAATHLSAADERATVLAMNAAVTADYAAVTVEARALARGVADGQPHDAPAGKDAAALRHAAARLTRAVAQIQNRDYFGAPGRSPAQRAVTALTVKANERAKDAAR